MNENVSKTETDIVYKKTENNSRMYKKISNRERGNKFTNVDTWFCSPIDQKIYLIFALICLLLLFYSIWEIKPVVVDIIDFLGLLSHFTLAYWIGYVLVVLFSVKLYLDNNIKKEYLYLTYLIVIGLFIFGVPVFAEDNARFPWSYYPAGEVKTVLEKHYIDFDSKYPVMTYRSWPAMHFISATMIYLTDIKIENLIKYMPLFWVFSVIIITFSFGKRLGLLPNQSFIASFLILASLWTPLYYYGPPSLSYLLYLLLFMFIVVFGISSKMSFVEDRKDTKINLMKDKIETTILICLTFFSLVIAHILTPIALISSFVFSSSFIRTFHKERVKFILFFLILFIIWNLFFTPAILKIGLKEFIEQAMNLDFFSFIKTDKYSAGEFLMRKIVHYSRLFYAGIYAITMVAAYTLYITGRIKGDNKERAKICFFWFAGILALLLLRYGANEIDDRVFLYSLVPMVFIMIFIFDRKILAVFAIVLMLPHLPAHYGTESFDLIRTAELNGAKFFSEKTVFDNSMTYFSMWDTFIDYYDPEKILIYSKRLSVSHKPDISLIDTSTFIINSDGSHAFLFYSYGFDPLKEWIESNQGNISLFYNNGHFQIYKNHK